MSRAAILALLMTLCTICLFCLLWQQTKSDQCPYTDIDTVRSVSYDTATIVKPTVATVAAGRKIRKRLPTAITGTPEVAPQDSTLLPDSVTVDVPVETKVYQDSNYRAVITGAWASLDTLQIWPSVETIHIRERAKPPRWTVNVGVGYGWDGRRLSPHIGVTVGYTLFSL